MYTIIPCLKVSVNLRSVILIKLLYSPVTNNTPHEFKSFTQAVENVFHTCGLIDSAATQKLCTASWFMNKYPHIS